MVKQSGPLDLNAITILSACKCRRQNSSCIVADQSWADAGSQVLAEIPGHRDRYIVYAKIFLKRPVQYRSV